MADQSDYHSSSSPSNDIEHGHAVPSLMAATKPVEGISGAAEAVGVPPYGSSKKAHPADLNDKNSSFDLNSIFDQFKQTSTTSRGAPQKLKPKVGVDNNLLLAQQQKQQPLPQSE